MLGPSKKMDISPLWLQVAVLTFIVGLAVLGYLALRMWLNRNRYGKLPDGAEVEEFTEPLQAR